MSAGAVKDYQMFASCFSASLPVIIESMLEGNRASLRMEEFHLAVAAMSPLNGNHSGTASRVRKRKMRRTLFAELTS
jgi:hypothetical protein